MDQDAKKRLLRESIREPSENASDNANGARDEASHKFSLKGFSIRGQSHAMKQQMLRDVHVLGRLALLGQVTHFYAAPGSGKTLLTLWLLDGAIQSGEIVAGNVFYVNADDNHRGLTEKTELAEELGIEMLAPGYNGLKASDLVSYLQRLTAEDSARGLVLILDTLKKFGSLMNKNESAQFAAVLREFSSKGGTVIGLAHVNKHRDTSGKAVYQGTSDLKDDGDCVYILDTTADDGEFRTVTFTNEKNRGDVEQEASYKYLFKPDVPWREKYSSIRTLNENDIARAKAIAATDRALSVNRDAIDAMIEALSDGSLNQGELLKAATSQGIARKAAQTAIKRHAGTRCDFGQFWQSTKAEKNSRIYSLNHGAAAVWDAKKRTLHS